jgi:hypothetical protein
MKKIIKLNESDLRRIVKNVIKENFSLEARYKTLKEIERNFLTPIENRIAKLSDSIESLSCRLEEYLQSHKAEIESDDYNELLEIAKLGQESWENQDTLLWKIHQIWLKRCSL